MKHLFSLNRYLVKYKWHLLTGLAFVTASNYFKIKIPQIIADALDYVKSAIEKSQSFGAELKYELLYFSAIIIAAAVLMGIFMYCMRQTIIVMSRLIEYDQRKELYLHFQKMDTAFFKRNKTGDLMSRISEDVSKVRMYLGPAILYGCNLSTTTFFVIYSMLNVSTTLTFYSLLPLPILSISIYIISSIINKKSTQIQQQLAKLNSFAQESYSGIRILKSYTKEHDFSLQFAAESEDYKDKSMALAKVKALFFPLMVLLIGVSTIATIYVGGLLVNRGEITYGNLVEFVIYINYLAWPFTAVGWVASVVQEAEASQKRINEFLEEQPLIKNGNKIKKAIEGKIEFRNVSFIYPDTGIQALKNLNFLIEPGQKVGIYGKTAAGKSTIAELIMRMFDVTSGQILIDDVDIKDYNISWLRDQIGYVPQDVFLFSETVADNINFGLKSNISKSRTEQYAKHAAIHDELLTLQKKYQTEVGERGVSLSGGQKQRISIARALIKDPKLVIFDDCLSAVDTKTENDINKYLKTGLEKKTALIITHRINFNVKYDQILVIEDGIMTGIGDMQTLLEQNLFFQEVFRRQELY